MSVKFKSSKNDNSYHNPNENEELEKKIDQLMSVEAEKDDSVSSRKSTKPKQAIQVTEDINPAQDDSISGAPLLPDELIPKEVKNTPKAEPPKETKKFYERSGPKPTTPKEPDLRPKETMSDELGLEDPKTNRVVDEIIAEESDELLASHDSRAERPPQIVKQPPKGLKAFLRSKLFRVTLLLVVFIAISVAAAVPTSRYFILNTFGVRAGASVLVLDETTGQPLKNAEFSIGDVSGKSGADGEIKLENLRLGPADLTIKKPAFEEVKQSVTLGWGSNPLGERKLKSTGSQFKVKVVDFLSKESLAKVEAVHGDFSAISNDNGEIVISVLSADVDKEELEIKLYSEGLREETVNLKFGQKDPQVVEMVPAKKHAFISKRSGTYDLYKVDIDGKNEEKVLAGTGYERPESIALSAHPSKNIIALVSSRDNSRISNNQIASNLTIVDLETNKATTVAQSERLQLIGWADNKVAFVKITEGTDANSQDRHKLIAYDVVSGTDNELASTNYFNDIIMANKSIYYTPSSHNANGNVGLFKTNIEGNNRKTVYDKEAWNILRTSYDELSVSIGQDWYTLNLGNDTMAKASSAPPNQKSRIYATSPFGGPDSLWVDERDGKGVLLNYNKDTKQETPLQTASGIKNPIGWINSKVITYRVGNGQETADYVMSIDGGEPFKVRDVTDTASIDRWYYY